MRHCVILFASILLMSYSAPAQASTSCPVLNGKYVRIGTKDGQRVRFSSTIYAKIERGIYSYTVDKAGTFQVSDGVPRPIRVGDRTGMVKVWCTTTTVVREIKADDNGMVSFTSFTPLSSDRVRIETDDPDRNGIYSLEK